MKRAETKFQRAINNLNRQAEKFANFDGSGAGVMHYGDQEYYDESSGSFALARSGMTAPAKRPLMVVKSHQNPGRKLDKAQFDINITRDAANIAAPLPIAIFGSTHLRSAYSQFITPPAGSTLVVSGGLNSGVAATQNIIRFAYSAAGPVTDNVDISCNQVPYPVFLEAMGSDIFRISNIRYRLTNNANTIQFSQRHKFQGKSLFGKGSDDDVNIGAYQRPEQFQAGIIDIPIAADVDKETMFILDVSQLAVAYPFSFTLSVFVEAFDKHDKMNLR